MTGPNWQAELMNRLDDDSAAAPQPAAAAPVPPTPEPAPPVAPAQAVAQSAAPEPTMPPPPPATGEGWGGPQQQYQPGYQQYAPQPQYGQLYSQQPPPYQQPQYPPQPAYEQPPYGPPPQVPPAPYQQPYGEQYPPQPYQAPQQYQAPAPQYYEPPAQQQGWQQPPPPQQQQQWVQPPPPQQPSWEQPPPQQPQWEQPPPPQQASAQQWEQPPAQPPPAQQWEQPAAPPPPAQQWVQPPPVEQPPAPQQQWEQPAGDGSWNAPSEPEAGGWNGPAPDGGPDAHAYTPAYQDPLAGPLPAATGSVGLQHEDPSGGFFRKIGRFAAEAAYIAGASGRMQRDVENIAIIRRPIGIGRMIGVIGPVPQSGTSTVTALLADAISSQRGDIVLAVDAYPLEGKLTHRLDQGIANTPGSRVQLARAEPTADAISDVLAARNVGGANQIPLSLVDCPAGLFEEATGYVAGAAHAVALVIPSSRDAALSSITLLDQLTTDGQHMLVDKGLVIIAENVPDDPEPVRWLQSAVSDRGLGYVVLPYDAHLARAWPLQPERLEPATRRAVLELAARLVQRATR
ncbi:MinD-like ATPase involved in chromosome partitioning or flagellar assembly [Kribbella voronezhensis]|uniref:MinD-like ATPase involved in chromosome partitioning or flagellar assembly n=1 Tax=Kribbella voronezhensis TaxID=2512212 RepID=A0A4R7SXK4_9ACTN|nr:hypothetical protein [Kribbella voronezhensis]TDU84100.1 MinD-like ATPase involved in chromosome partitioning or flagellar assembly [Kribbella voronezhensis]